MFHFKNSKKAPYKVVLPRANQRAALMELAQAFLTYEGTLAAEAQTPNRRAIETISAEIRRLKQSVTTVEGDRTTASEAFKRAERDSIRTVGQIHNVLDATFAATPERAQAWGLIVRQTGPSAGRILLPQEREDRLAFLETYIRVESDRPEAEQFTLPPLTQVRSVYQAMLDQRQGRDDAKRQRVRENARLAGFYSSLAEELRLAAGYLVAAQPNRQPDPEMNKWGFTIVTNTPSGSGTAVSEPTEPGTGPETDPPAPA